MFAAVDVERVAVEHSKNTVDYADFDLDEDLDLDYVCFFDEDFLEEAALFDLRAATLDEHNAATATTSSLSD